MARRRSTKKDEEAAEQQEALPDGSEEGRLKALEATLTDLTKRYGDGTVLRLGDASKLKVDVIPSGSLTLDIAVGVGGIPRGRITEIYGPESSGKCVTKDTHCLTEAGLLTVDEMFAHTGNKATCTNRIREQQFGLVNEQGYLETTSHFTWNDRKPIKRIVTGSGLTIEATKNHRLRVLNQDGYIVWRQANDLQVGDHLVVMRGTQQFGGYDLSEDEATFLGYLIADGALNDRERVAFANSDPEVMATYTRVAATLTETPIRSYARETTATIDHHSNSTALCALLQERYNLDFENAAGKTVPQCVRMASRAAQIAYLRAYFELECSIEFDKATIEVISESRKLLEQTQLLLLNLGIVSLLCAKTVDGATYYRLLVSGLEFDRFGDIIGFDTTARRERFAQRIPQTHVQSDFDRIPHVGRLLRALYDGVDTDRVGNRLMHDYMGDQPNAQLTYDRLRQIIAYMEQPERSMGHPQWLILDYLKSLYDQRHFFDAVATIEDDELPTFDVVMPETHSFWSNGLVSHNTTVCLHVIAEAQKRGGICAFVDMEHALDPTYAERIGVNVETLYISQPDTAEQALEITEALVRSSALDVVVLDSVAALVPRVEIEGEMGDSHVGVQARLMSQALRKLSGAIKQSNVAVMFTNQIREKIGVMYGSPETTSGGRALKFYSSVRLDIRRTESIKQGGENIGNRTRVRVTKNKVAPPFREALFDIMFGENGISKMGELVDLGSELGIIEKRGAFFRYNDGLLGQGRENAKQFLRENQAVTDEIEDAIRAHYGLPPIVGAGAAAPPADD